MSVDTTVLLLEVALLPSSLEEQLTKREVFVEHATSADVGNVLPVIVPDLIVQSGEADLGPVLQSLKDDRSNCPLVVIADRATIRRLRSEKHTAIKALIPKDLPIAAVAHRLSTMATRSAEGRPLENTQRREGARASRSQAPPKPSAPPASSKRGSLAPMPPGVSQNVKIFDPDEEERKQRAQDEREQEALAAAEAQQRAFEEARRKKKEAAKAAQENATKKRKAEAERQALIRKRSLEAKKRTEEAKKRAAKGAARPAAKPPRAAASNNTPSEVKALDDLFPTEETASAEEPQLAASRDEAEALEQTTQSVDVSAFAPALDAEANRNSSMPPARNRPAPTSSEPRRPAQPAQDKGSHDDVKKKDELSVIMPLPVDMRMELSPHAEQLPAIRLALLDTDLTRADAVSAALRDTGMKIHPITPDAHKTRWPMLRRFAPQGLVVDEKSMARGASEWVETFRGDPFLRHVPVILVRFSRLFDENAGEVTLDPLLHLIEHLGREEFALLEKLGPGKQVDLWLSQVAPYRLVEMLTKEDRNTRLDCKSRTERMVWHFGPGYAGKGKLADLKTNEPKERLSPEESMSWLLSHEDCQVAVHEHAEPLAHASESKDAEELLREMTDGIAAPTRHESVRPGTPSQAMKAPSLPQPAEASAPQARKAPPPTGSPQGANLEVPVSRKPLLSDEHKAQIRDGLGKAKKAVEAGYSVYREKLSSLVAPLEGRVPPKVLGHAHWMVALALLFLALFVIGLTGGEQSPDEPKPSESAPQPTPSPQGPSPEARSPAPNEKGKAPAQDADKPKEEEPEEDEEANLWTVASNSTLPSCESLLGPSTPKAEDPIKSIGYWKNARRLLMVGKSDEAVENMCLAGLLDPSGPASQGLAEYYLGQRSLKEAERWIQLSLKANKDDRKSKELLGDIENQKGNVEESRNILFDTMRLSGDETKKRALTARKLKQDALLARKSGDLPRAERELRRAVLLSPDDAVLAADLADTLFRRQAPEAAAAWAAHSIKLDPNFSIAMLLSGKIAEAQGNKSKAREFYEMVPIGDPFHKEAQRRRSRL